MSPEEPIVLYESPLFRERVELPMPITDYLDEEEVRRTLNLSDWVDLKDQQVRNAVACIWACRQDSRSSPLGQVDVGGIRVKTFGGVGFRLTCSAANEAGPFRRELNDVDYVVPFEDGRRFVDRLTEIHRRIGSRYFHFLTPDDRRFNNLRAGRRYRIRSVVFRDAGIYVQPSDIFVDRLEFCHTVHARGDFNSHEPALGLGTLLISKLQFIKRLSLGEIPAHLAYRVLLRLGKRSLVLGMEDKDTVDVAAAFASHSDETVFEGISSLVHKFRDWGLTRTVALNLGNRAALERVLSDRGASTNLTSSLASRMTGMAQAIQDLVPPPPRFSWRRTWWQEVDEA